MCGTGEYLLLGEAYDGACGHNFETWGNPAFAPEGHTGPAPHVADGWEARELADVSRWMLSRFASDVHDCECSSCAVAFVRADG